MKIADTILVCLPDMHTGSSTALFPKNGYKGEGIEDNHISPNERQREIYSIYARLMGEVAQARKGKRLIIVNLGDSVDGFHHNSMQESLFKAKDQCAAHVVLMNEFLKCTGFDRRKSDELYYVRGTEAHVGDTEDGMAKELGAVKSKSGLHVHEVLELNINGMLHVFAHHGKARGTGQNEGNALRNFLRDIRDDRYKDDLPVIDVLWSGHTHAHTYATHIRRKGERFHVMHGIICPSWQAKTIWALGKLPMSVNSIGGVYARITADGLFDVPHFVVKNTKDN